MVEVVESTVCGRVWKRWCDSSDVCTKHVVGGTEVAVCDEVVFERNFLFGRLERMIGWKPIWLQITPTHEADGGVELAVRRGFSFMILAVLCWFGFCMRNRSMHLLSKEYWNSAELETVRITRSPVTVITADGEVHTKEEATVCLKELELCVTVKLLEDKPAIQKTTWRLLNHGCQQAPPVHPQVHLQNRFNRT